MGIRGGIRRHAARRHAAAVATARLHAAAAATARGSRRLHRRQRISSHSCRRSRNCSRRRACAAATEPAQRTDCERPVRLLRRPRAHLVAVTRAQVRVRVRLRLTLTLTLNLTLTLALTLTLT